MTADVISLPRGHGRVPVKAATVVATSLIRDAIGEGRVQLRLVLDTPDQVERDLAMLADAVNQALVTVRLAVRTRDVAALTTVRALLEKANKRLNVRRSDK